VRPDSLQFGVAKAHRYELGLNSTYQDMAAHYDLAVVHTRAGPQAPRQSQGGTLNQLILRALLKHLKRFSCVV
jgi:hypothetical protein